MRAIGVSVPLVLLAATAQAADVWEVYRFDRAAGDGRRSPQEAYSREPAWRRRDQPE